MGRPRSVAWPSSDGTRCSIPQTESPVQESPTPARPVQETAKQCPSTLTARWHAQSCSAWSASRRSSASVPHQPPCRSRLARHSPEPRRRSPPSRCRCSASTLACRADVRMRTRPTPELPTSKSRNTSAAQPQPGNAHRQCPSSPSSSPSPPASPRPAPGSQW